MNRDLTARLSSIELTFRHGTALATMDVYREDRLVESSGATYLVLDFGIEERIMHMQEDRADDEQQWEITGQIAVEMQRINPDTGIGRAKAFYRQASNTQGEYEVWTGWTIVPGPRRPADALEAAPAEAQPPELDMAELVCVMCAYEQIDPQPVVQVDLDGGGHCASHVGENPPDPDDEVMTEFEQDWLT